MTEPADTLNKACSFITNDNFTCAAATLRKEYPFEPKPNAGRRYTPYESLQLFLKDGFRDRYTGQKLVNPAALHLISALMPAEFPSHPNWKQSESHIGFWELFPTIDHIIPVARGGADEKGNWITTSMLRNSAKGNALLKELGWTLHPPGNIEEWDGLTTWVVEYFDGDAALSGLPEDSARHRSYIQKWARASKRALGAN